MFAYGSVVHGTARRGVIALSIAIVSGSVACLQPDVTSPARDLPAVGSPPPLSPITPTPPLPPLVPWLQSPTWDLSDLRGDLLFSSTDTLYRVASHSAEPQYVIGFPYWPYAVHMSPDGTRAATLHYDEISGFLCVTNIGVAGSRQCVRSTGTRSTALAWTPDGQALVIGGSTRPGGQSTSLSIVNSTTLEFRTLLPYNDIRVDQAQSVTFSRDANTVSFVQQNQLWRMPMSGGVPELQPGFDAVRNLWAASWSPDGKSIALLSWNTDDHTLTVANADGSNLRVLARLPHEPNSYGMLLDRPVWSPDSEWLGLSLGDCLNKEPCEERIAIVSIGGKGARILSHQGLLNDWR